MHHLSPVTNQSKLQPYFNPYKPIWANMTMKEGSSPIPVSINLLSNQVIKIIVNYK